jgi:hypothetical protein
MLVKRNPNEQANRIPRRFDVCSKKRSRPHPGRSAMSADDLKRSAANVSYGISSKTAIKRDRSHLSVISASARQWVLSKLVEQLATLVGDDDREFIESRRSQ